MCGYGALCCIYSILDFSSFHDIKSIFNWAGMLYLWLYYIHGKIKLRHNEPQFQYQSTQPSHEVTTFCNEMND